MIELSNLNEEIIRDYLAPEKLKKLPKEPQSNTTIWYNQNGLRIGWGYFPAGKLASKIEEPIFILPFDYNELSIHPDNMLSYAKGVLLPADSYGSACFISFADSQLGITTSRINDQFVVINGPKDVFMPVVLEALQKTS